MFIVKAKIYGVSCNQPSSIAFWKHLVIGQRQKAPNIYDFHWSPHGTITSLKQGRGLVDRKLVEAPPSPQ